MTVLRSAGLDPLLLLALVLALALSIAFSGGPYGSDDTVYLARAIEVARGEFNSSNYNGALRFGFNIPAGVFLQLFGIFYGAAILLPLLAGLSEIVLIYAFAARALNRRTGVMAAFLLAFAPLLVLQRSVIHADAVVSAAITATFVAFWFAEERRSRSLSFAAGLAAGYVFWVKEAAIVFLVVFLIYPFLVGRWEKRWWWAVAGGSVMLFLHFILMWFISGNPFHGVSIYLEHAATSFVGRTATSGPFYYFRYLLLDGRHSALIGPLALLGIVFWWRGKTARGPRDGQGYALFWALGLLAVFSFLPISFAPLQFIYKQSNYLNLFIPSLSLLAAIGLDNLGKRWRMLLLSGALLSGLVLGALEQQAYRVFAANSKAVAQFAQDHPRALIYGTANNENIAAMMSLLRTGEAARQVRWLKEMGLSTPEVDVLYAVLDRETQAWGNNPVVLDQPPACWREIKTLEPIGFGLGRYVAAALARLPYIGAPFAKLLAPAPAMLYEVPKDRPWCGAYPYPLE
ncbi:MAG: ArnT family glycosyltransferase [Pseudomonadota bacterium]